MSYVILYSGIGTTNAKHGDTNAVISNRALKTASSNAAILNEIAKTTSSNAVIAVRHTLTPSSNAIIRAHQTKAVATNAIIERIHKTAQADAVIALTRTKTPASNAVIRSPSVFLTCSSNGVIRGHLTRVVVTSAVISGGGSLIPSNAVIATRGTKTFSSNALIKALRIPRTVSTNAAIALTRIGPTPHTNAIIQKHQTPSVSSSGVIAKGILTRGAISDINLFAEYLRLIGILMLVDPGFQTELNTVPSQQTFTFVKKVVKGLFYVDISGGGAILNGQVRTGDGVAYNQQVNVSVRILGDTAITATASTGTILAGAGTKQLWILTDTNGAFVLNLTGTGAILVEMIPKQGVVMSQNITL